MATKKMTKKPASKPAARKTAAPKWPKFDVSRSSKTGELIINGTRASQLVNKFPELKIQRAPLKLKHLSRQTISDLVRSMKVS